MKNHLRSQKFEINSDVVTTGKPFEHTLSNGIPVIFQNCPGQVAATYWWINTGSADENPNESGFAHFLEHMLFKDTAAKETGKASTGKLARAIESRGGDINAYTSLDNTVYHVTCAASFWEEILDEFGTIAKPQRFLKKDFESEREVILEEWRKNQDSPSRQGFEMLFRSLFSQHPYGNPVIGYPKILKAAKISDLEKFYQRQYVSENMGLVLVGPLEEESRREKLLQILERRFGQKTLPRKSKHKTANRRKVEAPLRAKPEIYIRPFDIAAPTALIGFRVPDLAHPDLPALDVVASILGSGETSRLYQKLFYDLSLVTQVHSGTYVPKDPGLLYLSVEAETTEKLFKAITEVFSVIKAFPESEVEDAELQRVLRNAESEKLYATQTVDGVASRLGFMKFEMGDLYYDQQYLTALKAVTNREMSEAARKYFKMERSGAVLLIPQKEKDASKAYEKKLSEALQSLSDSGSAKGATYGSRKIKKPKGAVISQISKETLPQTRQLSSGIKVIYFSRATPVFSVQSLCLGGTREELGRGLKFYPQALQKNAHGVSQLLSGTWTRGTSKLTGRQIAQIIEGAASGLGGFSGRNSIGLSLTGLLRDWNQLSELYTQVFCDPTFEEEELEHTRRVTEDTLRGIEDHSGELCSHLFLETLYRDHPYGKNTYGTLESIRSIPRNLVKGFHEFWTRPESVVISGSGGVSADSFFSWAEQFSQQLQNRVPHLKINQNDGKSGGISGLTGIPAPAVLKGPRWVERKLNREQTHIIVGGLGLNMKDPRRFALRILQNILGGQSGRLFIELREKRSMAYTVAPLSMEGIEPGYVGTYIACAPQKEKDAIDEMRRVLERLAKMGPTSQELKRAKEFTLGRRAMDLQSDSALASHFGFQVLYQLETLTESQIRRKFIDVTAQEVMEVCKSLYLEPHQVTAVVG